jgi:ketosteroid isomerase-like protein
MNDVYAINVAKTEFREGYNTGDINRLMATFHPDGFTDMSEGEASSYGSEATAVWRKRLAELFAGYHAKLTPIIIKIVVLGGTAYDYGWHELTLTPKAGGDLVRKRYRYFELWNKDASGQWKIAMHMTNSDVPEELNGFKSHWFLSEEASANPSA